MRKNITSSLILMLAISLIFAGCGNTTATSDTDTAANNAPDSVTTENITMTTAVTTTAESETEEISTTTEVNDISEPETETTTEEPEKEKYFTVEECLEKLIGEYYDMEIERIIELPNVGVLEVYVDGELEDGFGVVYNFITVGIDLELYRSGEKVNIDNFTVYENNAINYNPYLNP